jgi:hypothetical protein
MNVKIFSIGLFFLTIFFPYAFLWWKKVNLSARLILVILSKIVALLLWLMLWIFAKNSILLSILFPLSIFAAISIVVDCFVLIFTLFKNKKSKPT